MNRENRRGSGVKTFSDGERALHQARLCGLVCAALLVLSACWLLVPASYAQVAGASAAINGTITDPTGAVVPAAKLVLQNADTNVEHITASNETGRYVILNIAPGNYTLRVSKEGFTTAQQAPFTLLVNQTATLDFVLAVGSTTQTVSVEARAELLQISTAELGTVITSRPVVDLPLNGRNFTQLLTLTPGVSPANPGQSASGGQVNPVGSFSFPAVNGQTNRSNLFLLDGLINQGAFFDSYAYAPIIDAIQEFKVQSHNDVAEFGGVVGGVVNVVTKSGTNKLHGSAWDFLRNDALDARNPFAKSITPLKQNQFGVVIGGPVILPHYNGRNRTFFFAGYQGFRRHSASESVLKVPTAAELAGDFSDFPDQIYNPYSTRPDPENPGEFIRDPFVNNQITPALIHQGLARYAQAWYPAASDIGVAGYNARDRTSNVLRNDEATVRIDQQVGTKDFFWFRFSRVVQPQTSSAGLPGAVAVNEMRTYNYGLSYTHTFGANSVASFQFGRVVSYLPRHTQLNGISTTQWQDAGFNPEFASAFLPEGYSLNPTMNIGDYAGIPGEATGKDQTAGIRQYKGQFSTVKGRHTLKTGFEFTTNNYSTPAVDDRVSLGFITFQTANLQSSESTGNALASFLLSVPESAERLNVRQQLRHGWADGFFFQDQWKVTSKLTVNLGLRYDVTLKPISLGSNGGPYNQYGGNFDFNPGRGVYILGDVPPSCESTGIAPCIPGGVLPAGVVVDTHKDHGILDNDYSGWQPRVGFAYRLGSNTALRASYARFTDNWSGVLQYTGNWTPSWPALGVFGFSAENGDIPYITAENPGSFLGKLPPADPFGSMQCNCVDPGIKEPYSDQWTLGLQHQLTPNMILTANYVGSHGGRLIVNTRGNTALTPGPGDPVLRSPFQSPYIIPQSWDRSIGRSSYESLQVTLEKRFSRGMTYLIAYTWSKSMDIASSGFHANTLIQDPYNIDREKSVSGFDLPHMFTFSWVYELPFGKGKRFASDNKVVNGIIGGWQFNGLGSLRSGNVFNVSISGDRANTKNSGSYMRPNLVGDPRVSNPGPTDLWLNKSAYEVPERYTFGNLGRNTLRRDWFQGADLSIFRKFSFTESKVLEFRAEFFNAFNHPVWGTPNSSLTSTNFGRVSSTASTERQIQFGFKFVF
jgi:outer membrane receptor protein involved in Fe transport